MKDLFHLAVSYIRVCRGQTLALFFGILLSAALFTGVGSLFESGRAAALEHARVQYGDWHYSTRSDAAWVKDFREEFFIGKSQGEGYQLEKFGTETVRKVIEEPVPLQLVCADQNYLDMMGRSLVEGIYPKKENEIAADVQTLRNLNVPAEPGSEVTLDGETFTLSGILTEMPEKLSELTGNFAQVFVNDTLDYGKNGTFLYLKFRENGKVYRQAMAFCDHFGISAASLSRNNGLGSLAGAEMPANVLETIKFGLENKGAGIPYIWGVLNARGLMAERGILFALGIFGVFIIFSLFQISVGRRMAGYSVMQVLGMTDFRTFGLLLLELCLISAAAYPAGSALGNFAAFLLYKKAGRIFIPQDQRVHTGNVEEELADMAANLPDAGRFFINRTVILYGAVFLLCFLILISWMLVRRMKKRTARQLMAEDTGKRRKNRKLYSLRCENMAGVLTRKFMFARRGTFLGILCSLSVGSVVFLGAAYVTENTRINNELTFKADDGLGSDIQIYEESDNLADVIPDKMTDQMREVSGVKELHPVRYLLGEILLEDNTFLWPEFYPELGYAGYEPDAELMEKYNGIAVQTGEDDFRLKVNIYGYDDEMLADLADYLLEGSIDPDRMRRENLVILKIIRDGQGNFDGIDVHPGDKIPLKTVSSTAVPAEAYKFLEKSGAQQPAPRQSDEEKSGAQQSAPRQSDEGKSGAQQPASRPSSEEDSSGSGWYQEKTMEVAAVSARPLAKVDTFIGDSWDMVADIIMTNEQMQENFGVSGYQTISISLTEDADPGQTAGELAKISAGIVHRVVKDYSGQIAAQNLYLTQKMLFFYGIAAVLLGIGILHIANSMQHLVQERRHEFGILRAMGITDANFCRMLAREGLRYGIYSGLVITVLFFFVQRILYFFLVHVYLYLQTRAFLSGPPFFGVLVLNVVICVSSVLFSGRTVLKQQITDVIRK